MVTVVTLVTVVTAVTAVAEEEKKKIRGQISNSASTPSR
jgi:hypothetical protein